MGNIFIHFRNNVDLRKKRIIYTTAGQIRKLYFLPFFPDIYHVENSYPGKMESGVTFTIEPILSEGTDNVAILDDDWTAITTDHSRTAQVEHTVLITDSGCEILTI